MYNIVFLSIICPDSIQFIVTLLKECCIIKSSSIYSNPVRQLQYKLFHFYHLPTQPTCLLSVVWECCFLFFSEEQIVIISCFDYNLQTVSCTSTCMERSFRVGCWYFYKRCRLYQTTNESKIVCCWYFSCMFLSTCDILVQNTFYFSVRW